MEVARLLPLKKGAKRMDREPQGKRENEGKLGKLTHTRAAFICK